MHPREECPLAEEMAVRLRDASGTLTRRWLERVTARVATEPFRVFPTDDLLDHIPLLLLGLAGYLADPVEEISADVPVVGKAIELGELRHGQGFDAHEILKEYEILGGIVFAFLAEEVDRIEQPCTRRELMDCARRLARGIATIQQVTVDHYLLLSAERVRRRENQLRSFNRMVSHELKDRVGAVLAAADLLGREWVEDAERGRFAGIVENNARSIQELLENLIELSRLESPEPKRSVLLPRAAAEAARQMRELARTRRVDVRIAPDLPDVAVHAAAVELALSNYLSNAIKYSDPSKAERWVEVHGRVIPPSRGRSLPELRVEVRDNGLGVRAEERDRLFQPFFRAGDETVTGRESGIGLGLSIVRETLEALDGRAWAEFREDGSSFFFSLPLQGEPAEIPSREDETPMPRPNP